MRIFHSAGKNDEKRAIRSLPASRAIGFVKDATQARALSHRRATRARARDSSRSRELHSAAITLRSAVSSFAHGEARDDRASTALESTLLFELEGDHDNSIAYKNRLPRDDGAHRDGDRDRACRPGDAYADQACHHHRG
jgi:hypothetical protein